MGRLAVLLLGAWGLLGAQSIAISLKDLVERFDTAQAKVETLQAPFTLTLRRALLRTPSVTRGTVFLQGSDFVHFAFAPPEDLVLHLTPKMLVSYSPAAKQAERLKIGRIINANRKFLGLGQKLSYLSDYFTVGLGDSRELPGTHFLSLLPRTLAMKKRMRGLYLWVDQGTYLPRMVRWEERGGDVWSLELGALLLNQPLPPSVTGFKLPEGIQPSPEFSFFATKRK